MQFTISPQIFQAKVMVPRFNRLTAIAFPTKKPPLKKFIFLVVMDDVLCNTKFVR